MTLKTTIKTENRGLFGANLFQILVLFLSQLCLHKKTQKTHTKKQLCLHKKTLPALKSKLRLHNKTFQFLGRGDYECPQ